MCPRTSSFSSSLSILSLFFLLRFYPGTTDSTITPRTRCLAIVSVGNDDRETAFSFQIFIFPFYLSIIPQHCVLFLGVFFPPDAVCELITLFTQLLLHFCSTLTYLIFLSLKNTFFFLALEQRFLFSVNLFHMLDLRLLFSLSCSPFCVRALLLSWNSDRRASYKLF